LDLVDFNAKSESVSVLPMNCWLEQLGECSTESWCFWCWIHVHCHSGTFKLDGQQPHQRFRWSLWGYLVPLGYPKIQWWSYSDIVTIPFCSFLLILRHKRGIRVISGDNPLIFRSPFSEPFQVAPSMSPPCQRPKPASCWSSCRCCATCRAWDVSDLESRTFLKPVHLSLKDEDEDVDVCINQLQSPHGQGSSAPRPGVQHFVASMHSLFLPLHALPPANSTRIPSATSEENWFRIHSRDGPLSSTPKQPLGPLGPLGLCLCLFCFRLLLLAPQPRKRSPNLLYFHVNYPDNISSKEGRHGLPTSNDHNTGKQIDKYILVWRSLIIHRKYYMPFVTAMVSHWVSIILVGSCVHTQHNYA
jgi:hypothetical protein